MGLSFNYILNEIENIFFLEMINSRPTKLPRVFITV